jgi:hypothetical protein
MLTKKALSLNEGITSEMIEKLKNQRMLREFKGMRDNTDFWCCDELLEQLKFAGFTLKEEIEIEDYKFCPFCGKKLNMLI